jgi:GT2 family glycosyltransferase
LLLFDLVGYLIRKMDKRQPQLLNVVSRSNDHNPSSFTSRNTPKVSIIIPTRDKAQLLRDCVISVEENCSESNIELVIVDNDSSTPETLELLTQFREKGMTVLRYPGDFNYSAICNFAATHSSGEYLCLLNNDTLVLSPEWLESLMDHASQDEVGLVGGVLLYPGGSIQHAGIALGFTGVAGHPYRGQGFPNDGLSGCCQVSAVTFACAVISREKFFNLGGLDEKFPVGFNDVDMSIRAEKAGLKNVLCTNSILTHAESQTRPKPISFAGFRRAAMDVLNFLRKHPKLSSDPFFR